MGTNTGLNMQNGPAVGRRLGVNDLYTLSIYIEKAMEKEKRWRYLQLFARAPYVRSLQALHSELKWHGGLNVTQK